MYLVRLSTAANPDSLPPNRPAILSDVAGRWRNDKVPAGLFGACWHLARAYLGESR